MLLRRIPLLYAWELNTVAASGSKERQLERSPTLDRDDTLASDVMWSGSSGFLRGLAASGPAAEYAEQLMLYGQFVGDWLAETTELMAEGAVVPSRWDIRFDWVLEGRAIQDLWISPVRDGRNVGWSESGNRYSTTLRVYDPKIDAWHIIWVNPPNGYITRQLARKVGNEIVQIADVDASGSLVRWVYRDITRDSFRWCNERSVDQGNSWRLVQEMRARRK